MVLTRTRVGDVFRPASRWCRHGKRRGSSCGSPQRNHIRLGRGHECFSIVHMGISVIRRCSVSLRTTTTTATKWHTGWVAQAVGCRAVLCCTLWIPCGEHECHNQCRCRGQTSCRNVGAIKRGVPNGRVAQAPRNGGKTSSRRNGRHVSGC